MEKSIQTVISRLFMPRSVVRGVYNWFMILGPWTYHLPDPFFKLGYVWMWLVLGMLIAGVFMFVVTGLFRNNPEVQQAMLTTKIDVGAYFLFASIVTISAILADCGTLAALYLVGDVLCVASLKTEL